MSNRKHMDDTLKTSDLVAIPSLDSALDLGSPARLPLSSSAVSQPSKWWSNPGWKRRGEACNVTRSGSCYNGGFHKWGYPHSWMV